MKKLNLLFLLIFLCSCTDECEGIDCLSEDAFAFTIKSEATGEDLIFGNDPQISEDDLDVFYMENGVKITPHIQFNSNEISVHLKQDVNEYFITALGETDAVNVQFHRTGSTECCPSTTVIDEVSVNGDPIPENTMVIDLFR